MKQRQKMNQVQAHEPQVSNCIVKIFFMAAVNLLSFKMNRNFNNKRKLFIKLSLKELRVIHGIWKSFIVLK